MLHHSSEASPSHCSLPLAMLQALLQFGSPSVGELPAFIGVSSSFIPTADSSRKVGFSLQAELSLAFSQNRAPKVHCTYGSGKRKHTFWRASSLLS